MSIKNLRRLSLHEYVHSFLCEMLVVLLVGIDIETLLPKFLLVNVQLHV